jgi:hypothetical protein
MLVRTKCLHRKIRTAVGMTNSDRVLNYLKRIAPKPATNSQISNATGIRPHSQVFQITTKLEKAGAINGRLFGKEWEYWFDGSRQISKPTPPTSADTIVPPPSILSPRAFEEQARYLLQTHYGVSLPRGSVIGIPKNWDFCAPDGSVVGDAKYFTMVGGERNPPAKMSVIAEYVWLLSKAKAKQKFLIFGNDRRVCENWLSKHRHLVEDIQFWFLADDGELERLR